MNAPENPRAFPSVCLGDPGHPASTPGMSLRDWFAGRIAGGMAAYTGTQGAGYGPGDIAERSYQIADAMLRERGQ